MKKTVYIETTIPSYYYEIRKTSKAKAWREITREWWSGFRKYYNTLTSDVVLAELESGNHPAQAEKIALLHEVERLPYVSIIDDVVEEYISHKLVPKEYFGDGYHLAYASYYGINYLMTWNCEHLANPNKFSHIHIINGRLNLSTPVICTPEQLLTKNEEFV